MSTNPHSDALQGIRALALRMRNRVRFSAEHAPARVAAIVFAAATLLFTALLMLPAASADRTPTAFATAGFTVHSGGLTQFADHPFILAPMAIGVFVDRFGFPVRLNLIRARWTRHKWTLDTQLTLITTTVLLLAGAIAWAGFEWSNPDTMADQSWWQKLGHGLFASAMMRSGGFAVVETRNRRLRPRCCSVMLSCSSVAGRAKCRTSGQTNLGKAGEPTAEGPSEGLAATAHWFYRRTR